MISVLYTRVLYLFIIAAKFSFFYQVLRHQVHLLDWNQNIFFQSDFFSGGGGGVYIFYKGISFFIQNVTVKFYFDVKISG